MQMSHPFTLSPDLAEKVRTYIQEESFSDFANEARRLLQGATSGNSNIISELKARFDPPFRFGTAGFRARMEAGTARMNTVSVKKIAWAAAQYFGIGGHIVVGFDSRIHSHEFAECAAGILIGAGLKVSIFDTPTATPILSFAIRHFGATGGIMITASHNPPKDNGIKIYSREGAQVTRNEEVAIEQRLDAAPSIADIKNLDLKAQSESGFRYVLNDKLLDAYKAYVRSKRWFDQPDIPFSRSPHRGFAIAYTPLHGVGARFVESLAHDEGFNNLHAVPSQRAPDGRFPTVAYPNPEEHGALDEAIHLAMQISAEIIVANDPDADRLAVMVKQKKDVSEAKTAQWRMLNGNEVGVLLGFHTLKQNKATDADSGRKILLMSTVVSSRMLSCIANAEGASYDDTAPGFSRIMKCVREREATCNERFVFGYEEALGYCFGNPIFDKDGIYALMRILELAAHLHASSKTLSNELDELALKYGVFRSLQWWNRYEGHDAQDIMADAMAKWRNELKTLGNFAGLSTQSVKDWQTPQKTYLDPADILEIQLDEDTRLVLRPSGTEPKLKFYLEMRGKADSLSMLEKEKERLDDALQDVKKKIVSFCS
jgi:phosphomannomutase